MGARRGAKVGARPPPPPPGENKKYHFQCGGLPIFSLLWAFFFLLGPCNPCREPFFSLWGAFFVLVPPPPLYNYKSFCGHPWYPIG